MSKMFLLIAIFIISIAIYSIFLKSWIEDIKMEIERSLAFQKLIMRQQDRFERKITNLLNEYDLDMEYFFNELRRYNNQKITWEASQKEHRSEK